MASLAEIPEKKKKAQTAVEYLLLLAVVATVVLLSFRTLLPRVSSNTASGDIEGITKDFYDVVANGIMGEPPPG